MISIVALLLIVTLVTGLAWWAERRLGARTAERDFVWRWALVLVAGAPLIVLGQQYLALWRWPLPAVASDSQPITENAALPAEGSDLLSPTPSGTKVTIADEPLRSFAATDDTILSGGEDRPVESEKGPALVVLTSPVEGARFDPQDSVAWFIAAFWGAGGLHFLLRIVHGVRTVGRLVSDSAAVVEDSVLAEAESVRQELGLAARVRLAVSNEVHGPVVAGVFHPRILLPGSLLDPRNRADLRIALRHECAHLCRNDPLWNLLLQLVVAVYWFHPLVRLMERRLGFLREDLCDNHVLAGESPVQYAESLLKLALDGRATRLGCAGLGVFGSSRPLQERVEGLLAPERPRETRAAPGIRQLVAASALALSLAAVSVNLAGAEGPKSDANPAGKRASDKPAGNGPAPVKRDGTKSDPGVETVHGTVFDLDGSPASKVEVYLLGDPPEGHFTLPTHPQTTTTDEKGEFRFQSVAPGSYRVWAESGNRFSNERALDGARVAIEGKGPPGALTLRLIEGCRFRVTVRAEADGSPIKQAAIRFRWPDIERRFDTGEDGTVLIEGVRPREEVLEARAEGYAVEVQRIAKTEPGTTTELEFKLGPGGTIRGTVRDMDKKGLAGVAIDARVPRQPAELDLGFRRTDNEGRFEIPNVPLGETTRIRISKEGLVDQQRELTLTEEQRSQGVAFLMQRRPMGGSIAVEVVGPDDQPVADAELINPSERSNVKRTGRTDAEGSCQLDDVLNASGRYELNVKAKGFAPQRVNFEPGTAQDPTLVRVKLQPGHRIRAKVLLPDGKPAAKVWVFYNDGEHGNELGGKVDADDNGRFEVDSLPPGCAFTVYSPKGCSPYSKRPLPLDGNDEVVIRLEAAGLVRGRVLDSASGKAVVPSRVRIMVSQNRRPDEPAPSLLSSLVNEGLLITSETGDFEFGDLPPKAPMQLIVSADGYEPMTVERVLTEKGDAARPIDVRLKRIDPKLLRTVTIRLLNSKGQPQPESQVRLWTAADRPADLGRFPTNWTMITNGQLGSMPVCRQYLSAATDKDGRVTFRNVRTADFAEIAYWGAGIAPGRMPIEIDDAKDGKVGVELKAEAPVELTVEVDREAWPKAGQVMINGGEVIFNYESWVLKPGETSHVFRNLPAGRYVVTLSTPYRRLDASRLETDELKREQRDFKAGESATVRFGEE